ncbi:hypothetical protein NDU88_002764 [Pleurodeles waltl]|uniref:Uncharacterized protein n=1 Tax=Pleurodeles waltl TaxID=8319 RepID=A0AAV7REX8_PLEWA|nr:hypothetical protein NDU88_002764 [Pleurodeles waltl]
MATQYFTGGNHIEPASAGTKGQRSQVSGAQCLGHNKREGAHSCGWYSADRGENAITDADWTACIGGRAVGRDGAAGRWRTTKASRRGSEVGGGQRESGGEAQTRSNRGIGQQTPMDYAGKQGRPWKRLQVRVVTHCSGGGTRGPAHLQIEHGMSQL